MQGSKTMPKGGDFLPGILGKKMEKLHRAEKNQKAKSRLLVLMMRKEDTAMRGTEGTPHRPYPAVRNRLMRAAGRGPGGTCDERWGEPGRGPNPGRPARPRNDLIADPRECGSGHGVRAARPVAGRAWKRHGVRHAGRGMRGLPSRTGFLSRRPRPRHPGAASGREKSEFKKSPSHGRIPC